MSSAPSIAIPTTSHAYSAVLLTDNPTPWTAKLKSPAIKNMTDAQLESCIRLGEDIAEGRIDLRMLDERSLFVRGKAKKGGMGNTTIEKRKGFGQASEPLARKRIRKNGEVERGMSNKEISHEGGKESEKWQHRERGPSDQDIRTAFGILPTPAKSSLSSTGQQSPVAAGIPDDLHDLITTSGLTQFRQRVLLGLCQIPRGSYSTYLALSDHLASSPRAVGNALRNNPFAPRVPCHRIVAAGGGIGGFNGDWGDGGRFCGNKVSLLRDEGVLIEEDKGKLAVKGKVWKGFVAMDV